MISTATQADDVELLESLRRGDEQALVRLVERYHCWLVQFALKYVRDRHLAEEVAQETWIGVLRGLNRFAGRCSLRTWITCILVKQAKASCARETRALPFSALIPSSGETSDPAEYLSGGVHRAGLPPRWEAAPEERLLSAEVRHVVGRAIAGLAPLQREVIILRDVWGYSSAEACEVLVLTEGNQRVLLHRARSRVRVAVEAYLVEAPESGPALPDDVAIVACPRSGSRHNRPRAGRPSGVDASAK